MKQDLYSVINIPVRNQIWEGLPDMPDDVSLNDFLLILTITITITLLSSIHIRKWVVWWHNK